MASGKVCTWCSRDLGGTYYQQVTAWVANEKRDSVTLRKDVSPPTFACRTCIYDRQRGIPVDQESLLS